MCLIITYQNGRIETTPPPLDVRGIDLYTRTDMAARCELTGKGKQFGNNVSFSLRRTKRVFKPNLQKKTFMLDGKKVSMNLSTQAIRTLRKKGVL